MMERCWPAVVRCPWSDVVMSANVKFIGDDEAVRIWDISTKKCKEVLEDPGQRWGQITCLAWLGGKAKEDMQHLAFGTGRGFLIIFCRNRTNVSNWFPRF
jgi:hypothetical protein